MILFLFVNALAASLSTFSETDLANRTFSQTDSSALVLCTRFNSNAPLVITASGGSRQPTFTYDEKTEVYNSCSITWRNRFFVYGGFNFKNQISEVKNCGLRRVGSLDFDFWYGGCGKDSNDNVYLCFGADGLLNTCHKSKSAIEGFERTANSTHEHKFVRLAISETQLFVAGSITTHGNAELLNLQSGEWKVTERYPFGSYLFVAPVVYHDPLFIYFGGSSDNTKKIIAGFNEQTEQWAKLGDLNRPRWGSGVIEVSNGFLITGGYDTYETELCQLSPDNQMTCTQQAPSMTNYGWYPEMFQVSDKYCL